MSENNQKTDLVGLVESGVAVGETADFAAGDTVKVHVKPAAVGAEPEKSTSSGRSPPEAVTRTRTGTGPEPIPSSSRRSSADQAPAGSVAMRRRIRASL